MRLDNALELAWAMLDKHGLTQQGWVVLLDQRRRILGSCCHAPRAIVLSKPHIEQHTRSDVLDTILHEIAHGLVGVHHDHDDVWQAKAREIGAAPSAIAHNVFVRKTRAIIL